MPSFWQQCQATSILARREAQRSQILANAQCSRRSKKRFPFCSARLGRSAHLHGSGSSGAASSLQRRRLDGSSAHGGTCLSLSARLHGSGNSSGNGGAVSSPQRRRLDGSGCEAERKERLPAPIRKPL